MSRASKSSRQRQTRQSGRRRAPARRLPLDELLLRRRRWRRGVTVVVVVALMALIVVDRHGGLLYQGGTMGQYDGQSFRVARVIDGDTLVIAAPDGDEPVTRVRLWGVDTPELARNGRPAEPGALEAQRFARERVANQIVRLELEPHRVRGSYGRVLAFVYGPDGQMLNEALLVAGLTEADDRWSHRYLERFELLEMQARQDGRGLWGEEGP